MEKTKRLITFSDKFIERAEKRAESIGFSFGEYVRFVIANDLNNRTEFVEMLDEETEKDLAEAREDAKNGRITHVEKGHIAEFINSLVKETK